jgi:DGQHR domain-containing protein
MPSYDGILIKQRAEGDSLAFFAFATNANDILSWSDIVRTAEMHGAAQRIKNDAHISAIKGFMNASPENIIPTTVTLAVSPGKFTISDMVQRQGNVSSAKMTIEVTGDEKAAFVIDGQHRLLAFAELAGSPPLLACAILGASELERALHFVVINNKTKRVPSDLVKAIVAELSGAQQEALKNRLTRVGITLGNFALALNVLNTNDTSPFINLVDWDINRGEDAVRRIKPAALEAALRTIISNLRANVDIDVDDAIQLLSAIWRGVRDAWNSDTVAWNSASKTESEHSKLVDKAGLVAVTEFIVERLNHKLEEGFDVNDLVSVEAFSKAIMLPVPSRFWSMKWTETGLDTSAGRSLIRQSLAEIRTGAANGVDDPLVGVVLVPSSE